MKSLSEAVQRPPIMWSPPSRGAWIEILYDPIGHLQEESPPSRGAWIEIPVLSSLFLAFSSPPSRGAWIEMPDAFQCWRSRSRVAPLAGGVD